MEVFVPGPAGSGAGSAGAPNGFVAAEVGRLGGGVGGGAVENGVGLERAKGNLAGHGVTQERAAEEERGDKGVREEGEGGSGSEGKFGKGGSQETGFQGGSGSHGASGSEGKFGKGGWQEAGFQGGSDPWGGWRGKGSNGQGPILESPPGFAGNQFGQQEYPGIPLRTPISSGSIVFRRFVSRGPSRQH